MAKTAKEKKEVETQDLSELTYVLNQQKETIDKLTKMVESLSAEKEATKEGIVPQIIMQNAPNKYIKVVSLREGILVLSTEPFGKGKTTKFTKYGETKSILDTELKRMVDSNFSFAENGYFYICDENFVHENELEAVYKNILSPEDISVILNSSSSTEVAGLFRQANEGQRETIVNKIVNKAVNGDYSEDIISRLEKETGAEIREKIENSKSFKEALEEEEEEISKK